MTETHYELQISYGNDKWIQLEKFTVRIVATKALKSWRGAGRGHKYRVVKIEKTTTMLVDFDDDQ